MVVLTDDEKKFIKENFDDSDSLITSDTYRSVLRAIYDLIDEKGFAPPDYYDYNDFGRKAQRVYDNIFINNATEDELATRFQPTT